MPDHQDKLWNSIAHYCNELAPVVGPLLAAVGATASALERASSPSRTALNVSHAAISAEAEETYD